MMKFIKMGCDEDIVKCSVFWTNFVLALVGISLISVGIIYKVNLEEFLAALPEHYEDLTIVPILTAPLGTSLIILAVFGCYGCLTERKKIVAAYIIILLLLFVIQISIGISCFYRIGNKAIFRSELESTVREVFENNSYINKSLIDLIQHRLKCCGLNGPNYWTNGIPQSCYQTNKEDIFENSCTTELYEYINYCQYMMGVCITVLSFAQVIASVVSLFFVRCLKNSEEYASVRELSLENGLI
ncbi:unnamed protein product [Phyllotreta striolata]|uniref:Tetraspanin n=1 Tax=Phyllotreta striolata TaxID=444603 RepID=A0A9N9XLL0_PHYSR|nr:unnamed protein product [Phyllotreta striolata]